ncbi:MAG TPA: calcium/sodium antiporter [Acidobacteriota bacterium]|nr:calcium/sodium antiporter [Acidobacteriota bacterium]
MPFLYLVLGLAALYWGAEWLVRGASRIAFSLHVSSLAIGLTVVAFGTSMPEMVAGGVAAWRGNTDIVLGNVFGSNIANVGLILAVAALLRRIPVSLRTLQREMPLMMVATVLVYVLASNGEIGRVAGIALVAALIGFTWLTLRWAGGEFERVPDAAEHGPQEADPYSAPPSRLGVECGRVIVGLAALGIGAQLLVGAALQLARELGVSEFVISVSVVALGTSLPELATSVVAALRGETDVLVGNIVGSNIFNLLGALGVGAMIRPLPVAGEIVAFDIPVVLAFTVAMILGLGLHRAMVRWEGALLLLGYAVYIGRLAL